MRVVALLVVLLVLAPPTPGAAEKKSRKKESGAYAVVAGSVFRDSGMALSGAEITLAAPDPSRKSIKMTVSSDSRGEFAFRVPAGQGAYTLTVRAKGYQGQEKAVTTTGEERIDVFFRLDPASK